MFAVVTPILTLLAAAAIYVRADPNPNSPSPGDVFIQGQSCTTTWDVDTTGIWKTMNIDLMTGDNFNMFSLMTVGTVDGTDPSKNTFSYTCPQVTPHSPIYFYQFTSPSTVNKTWTGRFTITDSVNNIVAPSQSTQPDGENIPWGTGSLVTVNGSSSAAPSGSGPLVVTPSAGGTPTSSEPSIALASGSPLSSTPASNTSTPGVGSLASNASATPSTGSTTGTNGAVGMLSVSNILFQTALALAFAAFGFTMMV